MSTALQIYTPQVRDIEDSLQPYMPKFSELLPASITPQHITTCAMAQLMNNEYAAKIAAANPLSVAMSLMTACTLALLPDGVSGQGHLVPFAGQAPKITFMPGYQGYITLAARGGYALDSYPVHSSDEFEETPSSLTPIRHAIRFPLSPQKRGEVIGYYALAKHASEPMRHHVMPMEDILKVRDSVLKRIPDQWKRDKSIWTLDFPAMARKTPIRFVGKKMPLRLMQIAAGVESLTEDAGRPTYLRNLNEAVVDGSAVSTDNLPATAPEWEAPAPLQLVTPKGETMSGKIPHMWASRLLSFVAAVPDEQLTTLVNANLEHIRSAEAAGHVVQARAVKDAIAARQRQIAMNS